MQSRYVALLLFVGLGNQFAVRGEDTELSAGTIRSAIEKTILLLEAGAKGSADQRKCFTCHNQAVPVLALAEARKRGFAIDEENFQRQVQHTEAHLKRGRKDYLKGKGQGGRVLTAGYALWTLEAGERPADETTAAVTSFLLNWNKAENAENHWRQSSSRPPSSGSDFTATYLALSGLVEFGTEQQRPEIDARVLQVSEWIRSEPPRDTEDQVFQLLSLPYLVDSADAIRTATSALIGSQREDGGWSQRADMESDAYATATALFALLHAADISNDHAAVHRAMKYLLSTQLPDGSWHVVTRAKPFQTYFETGFPHDKDQFISIAASGWATLALLLTLPEKPAS